MAGIKRTSLFAATVVVVFFGLLAGTALAKPKPKSDKDTKPVYTYTATIDCGPGPVTVKSTDDMFAPLLDPDTGRKYQPVAWDVRVGERRIKERKPGRRKKPTVDCSYTDGEATGTVTVERPRASSKRSSRSRHKNR
jgi:hypothetical protein